MGLLRYWQPPTHEETLANSVSLFSGLSAIFFFFFIVFGGHLSRLFFFSLWLFSIMAIIMGLKMIIKSGKSIGIDIGIVTLIFLIGTTIIHLFMIYFYFWVYLENIKQSFLFKLDFYRTIIPILLFSLTLSMFYWIKAKKMKKDLVTCFGQSTTLFLIANSYFIIMLSLGVSYLTSLIGIILYVIFKNIYNRKKRKR
jgi:hypothetical protein